MNTQELCKKIRLHALQMTSLGGSSHIASVLSIADILAVLYGHVMNIDPLNPKWEDRDRFILSKGHAGAGVYAALAERGFFPTLMLQTHYQDGSLLSGHVSHKGVPGVELSTGSLGHGLPVGVGFAIAAKKRRKSHRVFVLLSDGECDEGSNWEAFMFSGYHRLSNLTAIIDYNKYQSLAKTSETLDLEPFRKKLDAFRWEVRECDGHNHQDLIYALKQDSTTGQPVCVLAHTIKGHGVPFMENSVLWHYRSAKGSEYEEAKKALSR